MTKGRDIAIESIGDLLEVARLQQRSGLLRAEYSQGGHLEEGELYLQAGQPIYARVGNLTGHEAFNYLLSWRNIHFAFSADGPRPPANLLSSVRTGGNAPFNPVPSMPEGYPTSARTGSVNAPAAPTPSMPEDYPTRRRLRWDNAEEPANMHAPQRTIPLSGMGWRVPEKVNSEQDVLSLSLTRRQRLIYLLIDGQRTVNDLARTAGKAALEVELILSELQERGLIFL